MKPLCSAALVLAMLAQAGCGAVQKPSWSKPWGRGAWIPALVCGAIGTGVGIAIQDQRQGCSTVTVNGVRNRACDDDDLWKGAVIGFPAGFVLCGLLGHVFLDPTPEPTFPPPPPPIETPTPAPEPAPVVKQRIVLRGVNFDFDKSDIREDSRPILDEAVSLLADHRDVLVIVGGHTDARGTEAYNQALSVRRAEAVFRYLVNRGIAPERLRTEGFGESKPVADNDTDSGRARNRRVELRVMP